ncbi:MAG: PHP domain-containing protein, partial [Armatimonadota bacterium]|nr:PHP domain-containing protein [Armatimonadota bacterium]
MASSSTRFGGQASKPILPVDFLWPVGYNFGMSNTPRGIDLHAHTTASDGSLSPTELVQKAAGLGLAALAVTDHDTIGGLEEALTAATEIGLDLVTGVELAVEDDGGRFHLLGYLFAPD